MFRTLMAGLAALAASLPVQASAQASSDFSMYSRGHFKGLPTSITGPAQFGQPLVVRSVVLPAGAEWELCSGKTYTGCRQISESTPSMVMTVRSARPVAAILRAGIAASSTAALRSSGGLAGQSLRGTASEYFVAPDEGGNRVEVRPGTAEAMSRRAGDFCRARGWRSSVHGRLQAVGGAVYLADVLCIDN